ncbi:hypothetical protein C8R43DRAFT_1137351 [Mycena crocata]|nr:hypothetical protein C8R43DRAFT_1137351 [Mycena crocata]
MRVRFEEAVGRRTPGDGETDSDIVLRNNGLADFGRIPTTVDADLLASLQGANADETRANLVAEAERMSARGDVFMALGNALMEGADLTVLLEGGEVDINLDLGPIRDDLDSDYRLRNGGVATTEEATFPTVGSTGLAGVPFPADTSTTASVGTSIDMLTSASAPARTPAVDDGSAVSPSSDAASATTTRRRIAFERKGLAEDEDWRFYYVNFFVDRDMYMRYRGGGVGHYQVTIPPEDATPVTHSDDEDVQPESPTLAPEVTPAPLNTPPRTPEAAPILLPDRPDSSLSQNSEGLHSAASNDTSDESDLEQNNKEDSDESDYLGPDDGECDVDDEVDEGYTPL